MRNILYIFLGIIALYALTKSIWTGRSPEALAHRACDCWSELKTISNSTARANKMDECYRVTRQAQSDLRDMGVSKDWNDQQVKQAEDEFDAVYSACTGGDTGSSSSSTSTDEPTTAVSAPTSSPPVESEVNVQAHSASYPTDEEEPRERTTQESAIFSGPGQARIFNVSMNTIQAVAQLVLNSDSSIVGTMAYPNSPDHASHRVRGRYNADGTISLDEYTSSETEKELVCTLTRAGDCFEGDGKNLMNDSVSVSLCLQ